MEIIGLDKAIKTINFKEIPKDTEDRIVEKIMGMIGAMNTVEVGTGQEKGHLQEVIIIETEVPATAGQGKDLELV